MSVRSKATVKESVIQNKILKWLKQQPDIWCYKAHASGFQMAGIPDIIACVRGQFVAFEVKTEIGKATILQQMVIRDINAVGGNAVVVRSLDEVRDIVDAMRPPTER